MEYSTYKKFGTKAIQSNMLRQNNNALQLSMCLSKVVQLYLQDTNTLETRQRRTGLSRKTTRVPTHLESQRINLVRESRGILLRVREIRRSSRAIIVHVVYISVSVNQI